jgi:Potential Queuosine, Q, salvage protein family
MEIVDQIRSECARVAAAATQVQINHDRIPDYGSSLQRQRSPAAQSLARHEPAARLGDAARERAAAYWLTLNSVNFGSGWFPTLLKMPGMTGYRTIKAGIDRRFKDDGPWSAQKLQRITMAEISTLMMQEPDHPLMPLFKASMRDLGAHIETDFDGQFTNVIDAAGQHAVRVVETVSAWDCFTDVSKYQGRDVPFLKRAQIAAADLQRAGAADWLDIDRLTLFADNLVPHVLRLDGVLSFDDALVEQIAQEQLIEHGSPQEVEYRACALHAVELIADATDRALSPAVIDELLWNRGQQAHYKAVPRPRSRSTAY